MPDTAEKTLESVAGSRPGDYHALRTAIISERLSRIVACALLMVDLTLMLLYAGFFLSGYSIDVLAIGLERSFSNWYATAKLLIMAQLLAFLAWRTPVASWWQWSVLVAPVILFLLLSIEEVAGLHDRVERRILPRFAEGGEAAAQGRNLLPLLFGLPLGIALIVAGTAFARIVRPPFAVAAKAAAGAAIFLLGAIGTEILIGGTGDRTVRVLPAIVEEGGELVGISLLLWATLDLAIPHFRRAWPASGMAASSR